MKTSLLSYFGYRPMDPRAIKKIDELFSDQQKVIEFLQKTSRIYRNRRKKRRQSKKSSNKSKWKIIKNTSKTHNNVTSNTTQTVNSIAKKKLSRLAKIGVIGGAALGLTGAALAAKKIIDHKRKIKNNKIKQNKHR